MGLRDCNDDPSWFCNNETAIRLFIRHQLSARLTVVTDELVETVMNQSFSNRSKLSEFELDEALASYNGTNGTVVNYTTIDGCGGPLKRWAIAYANEYHPYCAIIVCLFGIVANCLNIIILTRKDMASAPINRILTALAWADMLLMIEYIPFTIYDKLDSQQKELSYNGALFILFHIHVTQILHTTSICLTLTLAVWRFLAIRFIEKNHILCSHQRCTIGIALCYVLPFVLCIPQYASFKIEEIRIREDEAVITLYRVGLSDLMNEQHRALTINFWIYSIVLKLLPCLILIVISAWLIRTLFKAKKGRQVLKGYDNLLVSNGRDENQKKTSKYERRADRTTKMLVVVVFLFLVTEMSQGLFALVIALVGKELFLTCYQLYGEIMDMCALLNGSINFILYCCMNRMFRITFGQLFRSKILNKWVQPAISDTPTLNTASSKTNVTAL